MEKWPKLASTGSFVFILQPLGACFVLLLFGMIIAGASVYNICMKKWVLRVKRAVEKPAFVWVTYPY